jgi:hypothetical protein
MIGYLLCLCKLDIDEFMYELAIEIRKMEEKGMDVEVQYQVIPKRPIVYSALLIGREIPKIEVKGGE